MNRLSAVMQNSLAAHGACAERFLPVDPSPKRPAFIWRRQFSFDQMEKIKRVHSAQGLSPAIRAQARYARCQLQDTDRRDRVHHCFNGDWEGHKANFELCLRPLFVDYAAAVYTRVLQEAFAYYPNFQRHYVEDGPYVGERRLVFPDQLDEAAAYWMRTRFWDLAEKGDVHVSESFSVQVNQRGSGIVGYTPMVVTVALDRERIDRETWEEVRQVVSQGRAFPVDTRPRQCDSHLSQELLAELSQPELAMLNWDDLRKPLTAVDRELFAAIEAFDLARIAAALAAGADPNAVSESAHETPLTLVAEFRWADRVPSQTQADYEQALRDHPGPAPEVVIEVINRLIAAGAAVDWADLNETTPLAEACLNSEARIVEHLLKLGADPSIRCYDDECPGEWGTAWEFADYRGNPVVDNDDESAWNALVQRWPPPYGGVQRV